MSSESILRAKLTKEEKDKYYEIFKMFDIKKNGSFSAKELSQITNFYGMNLNEQELLDMILVIDSNGNGKINFDEFLNGFLKRLKNPSEAEEELRDAFKVFDKEGNGFISVGEFKKIMTELGDKLTPEEVDEMIREVGTGGAPELNYEEFITVMSSAHK